MDGGYWGVMPGEVLHDRELTAAGKLLYLLLSSMAHSSGYCWPSNEMLAEELSLSKRRVRELLAALQKRNYIRVQIRRAEDTNEVERRYIYCGLFPGREDPAPSGENPPDPPAEDCTPSGEISPDPPAKSRPCIKCMNLKGELIPPLPPTGEKRAKAKRDKSAPKWKPERFEAFWNFYRINVRGEDRQGAVLEWDRLKPDDALIAVMGKALQAQIRSDDWQRGIGIPYAKRWLKYRRWEDTPKAPAEETPPGSGGKSWEERWESEFGWH